MKRTITAFLLPLACSLVFFTNAANGDDWQNSANHVTTFGCLQRGIAPDIFVLTSTCKTAKSMGCTSQVTPNMMARSEMSPIILVPQKDVDLEKYVGHMIRAEGMLVYQNRSQRNYSYSKPGTCQLELQVTSVKKITGSCK